MFAPFSKFCGKICVCFCLNTRKRFFLGVIGSREIALRLRDRHVFLWLSVKILNVFNTLSLQQIFWKTKTFIKKLKYCFLVECTKIENAPFPYKTAISKPNVKTNRVVGTKWTYHREWSFASTYLFYWKFCFSLRTSYIELIWCTNYPNVNIHNFWKCWSFIWRCLFPVTILNIKNFFIIALSKNITSRPPKIRAGWEQTQLGMSAKNKNIQSHPKNFYFL